jgi:hypothetical protein
MTRQYDFETVKLSRWSDPGRGLPLSVKRQAQYEAREQREIEGQNRTSIRIRTMLVDLEREITNLEVSINSELALASVRDRTHFAYPISARMMESRRENLKATVAALSERLASIDLSKG